MPPRNNVFGNTGLIVSLLLFSTGMAHAQVFGAPQPERQAVGVLERERPAYDAKGIPLGGFRLYPRLNFDTAYDDNVFRLPAAQSDWYFRETPTLRLRSQWGQHFLEVYGGADNYNYSRFSSLDLTDWNMGAAGRSRSSTPTACADAGAVKNGSRLTITPAQARTYSRYFIASVSLALTSTLNCRI